MGKARIVLSMLATILAGCAPLPIHTAHLPESELRRVSDFDLCAAYASTEAERLAAEMDRRNLIPAGQWKTVAEHQVMMGMSACAVLASLGYPADTDEVSSADGSSADLIYLDPDLFVQTWLIEIRGGVATSVRH